MLFETVRSALELAVLAAWAALTIGKAGDWWAF